MPKPYSQDLRKRVVDFVEAGHSRRAAARHFDVSPSFVVNLMTAYRLRGSLVPKPVGGRRHAKLDPHRAFLLARLAEKNDITMPELAGELEAHCGTRADPASLSRWLIRCDPAWKSDPRGGGSASKIGSRLTFDEVEAPFCLVRRESAPCSLFTPQSCSRLGFSLSIRLATATAPPLRFAR